MEKWITWTAKLRWGVLALWVAFAAVSVLALPDLQHIVQRTEQKFLPTDAESEQAGKLLAQINPEAQSKSTAVAVLSRDGGLKGGDKSWFNDFTAGLVKDRSQLGIISVLTSATQPQFAERFLSKDGTTAMALIGLPQADYEEATKSSIAKLKALLKDAPAGTTTAITGSAAISQDFQQSSQDGLKKSEALTVGLVLLILLVVFRSPVAAIIPLLTIGISLVVSRGLIAVATDYGVPVSNFTESFLIAVLFGAGTDYCILMIQRYREELSRGGDHKEALVRTMRGVGKTVLFSASTVFVAFFLIGFAQFGLYQSAVGVSIGVLVTLLAGMTLTPALLLLFGRAVFWPFKVREGGGYGPSKLWGAAAKLSAKRAGLLLAASVILLSPITLLFQGKRSFDDIAEINPDLGSVVGFRQVEKAFGSGEVFPLTMAVALPGSAKTPEALLAFEQASATLAQDADVHEVRSAMRPLGRPLFPAGAGQKAEEGDPTKTAAAVIGQLKQALETEQMKQALSYYVSEDGKIAKLDIILKSNPYSGKAMDTAGRLTDALRQSLADGGLPDAKVYASGTSASYNELRDVSFKDFLRTGGLVLAGIAIVLILLLRSVLAPIYVLLSLAFNYLVTMGIVEWLFVKVLGYPGLSWTVSFFVFLIVVALGVDYSIFLMARFKEEYRPGNVKEAMAKAMRTTGSVLVSAAVIMGGTFGALGFSGVVTLMQIGVGTLIGLLLYATVFMGLIVPSFSFLLGEANWWPLSQRRQARNASEVRH